MMFAYVAVLGPAYEGIAVGEKLEVSSFVGATAVGADVVSLDFGAPTSKKSSSYLPRPLAYDSRHPWRASLV